MNRSAAGVLVAAIVAGAGGVVAAVSCIPDLVNGEPDAAPVLCGDGIIELDAGEQCDPGPAVMGDASIGGCTGCKVDCPNGSIWPVNDHCYWNTQQTAMSLEPQPSTDASSSMFGQFPPGPQTVRVATTICANGGGHVVTFASEDEYQQVLPLIGDGQFWVGLKPYSVSGSVTPNYYNSVHAYEPGWSPYCPGCYAHGEGGAVYAPLPSYMDASPDAGPTDCVVGSADAATPWQQYPCSITATGRRAPGTPVVLCESEPVGKLSSPCEAGVCFDLVATYPCKHYVYRPTLMSSLDAWHACKGLRGDLVVLESPEEREQLWRELSNIILTPPYQVWIGLAYGPGGWVWDDNAQHPSQWGNNQPGPYRQLEQYAYLWHIDSPPIDDTLARNDVGASSSLSYVCQIPGDCPPSPDADAGADAGLPNAEAAGSVENTDAASGSLDAGGDP